MIFNDNHFLIRVIGINQYGRSRCHRHTHLTHWFALRIRTVAVDRIEFVQRLENETVIRSHVTTEYPQLIGFGDRHSDRSWNFHARSGTTSRSAYARSSNVATHSRREWRHSGWISRWQQFLAAASRPFSSPFDLVFNAIRIANQSCASQWSKRCVESWQKNCILVAWRICLAWIRCIQLALLFEYTLIVLHAEDESENWMIWCYYKMNDIFTHISLAVSKFCNRSSSLSASFRSRSHFLKQDAAQHKIDILIRTMTTVHVLSSNLLFVENHTSLHATSHNLP